MGDSFMRRLRLMAGVGLAVSFAACAGCSSSPTVSQPGVASAQAAKSESGFVVLELEIDASGTVTQASVVESIPAGVFDKSAIEAAKKWRYKQKLVDGKPVAFRVRLPIEFKPKNPPPEGPQ